MTKTRFLFAALLALFFGALGSIWLYAQQPPPSSPPLPQHHLAIARRFFQAQPQSSVTPQTATPTLGTATATPTPMATTTHVIDWVTITPLRLVAGAPTPVVITAQISDPNVIRNSVNLIYVTSSGTQQIIGTLNDTGINGDQVANDNLFTFSSSTAFISYPPGLLNLSISAAFSGALQRTQANISITILQSEPISNPVPVSDSQGLFSLSFPASWAINAIESQAQGAPETEDVDFNFPDGTTLFTIIVYPISTWGAMQTSDEPLPVYLGQNSQFVFAYSGPQDGITGETVDANSIAQTLPQLLATFKITQQ